MRPESFRSIAEESFAGSRSTTAWGRTPVLSESDGEGWGGWEREWRMGEEWHQSTGSGAPVSHLRWRNTPRYPILRSPRASGTALWTPVLTSPDRDPLDSRPAPPPRSGLGACGPQEDRPGPHRRGRRRRRPLQVVPPGFWGPAGKGGSGLRLESGDRPGVGADRVGT